MLETKKDKKKTQEGDDKKPKTLAQKKVALRSLMNRANGKAKHTVIAYAEDIVSPYFLRRPSGIMQLDIDTGGGLAAGGVSMLSGPDNSGKTLLMFKYFAMHQRLYGDKSFLAYAPVEGAPDYDFMKKCGIRVALPQRMIEERAAARKFRGLPPFTKEELAYMRDQVGEFLILGGQTGEDLLDVVLDATKQNIFGIIGIDSFTALQPEALAETATLHKDPQRAAQASLITQFFQKFYPFMTGMWGRNDTTLLCTQQVRSNQEKANAGPAGRYMRDYTPAGGYAAKHGKLLDLLVWSSGKEREDKTASNPSGTVVGKDINWDILKGKAGAHDNTRGAVAFRYDRHLFTDDLNDLISVGLSYGVISEQGGLLSVSSPTTGEILPNFDKIGRSEDFVNYLKTDIDLEIAVRHEILAAAKIECAYR
jgi:RecA/RadA recombinase